MINEIWNSEIETLDPLSLRKYEEPKLIAQLKRVYVLSSYYRRKFDVEKIKIDSIQTMDALQELPFTEKSDFVDHQANGELFGGHQCVPYSEIVRIAGTGGSSGTPTRLGWTKDDVATYNEMGARALWAMDCRPDDLVINCFNYSIYAGGIMDHGSFEYLGAGILAYGVGQTERLLALLSSLPKTNVKYALYSTPSYAIRIANLAQEKNIDLKQFGVGKGFFSGEPGLQVRKYRSRVEKAWGMSAMDLYGAAEVGAQSGECQFKNGMHYCGGGHVTAELIDSDTCEVKKMHHGETGELVFTTLTRQACPIIRLRTHDTVQVYTDPCECGRKSFRFHVLGRNDDMFIVKGVNIFPLGIQETLLSFQPQLSGEFLIVLKKEPPIDYNPIVMVETGAEFDGVSQQGLLHELTSAIQNRSNFTPEIHWVKPNTIVSEQKTKRLYRKYLGEIPPVLEEFK